MAVVLVTGGRGRLGRVLVPRLRANGHRVRLLSRRAADDSTGGAELAVGDLLSGRGVQEAVSGVEVVVHCATTNGRRDVDATRRVLDAARQVGVRHLVYVSIVGVDAIGLPYYRAKWECEQLVEASGVAWTVQRATQFHDLIREILDWQRWSPVVVMPAGISFQPIDVGAVADTLAELLERPSGRAPDIGGPEVRLGTDLARIWAEATGRRRVVAGLPLPGRVGEAYRRGRHLAPAGARGRGFADFLAGQQ